MSKRSVEVFTAGCPLCDPAVRLVEEMACSDCEVTIHAVEWAGAHGITRVPAVVVDGRLLSCCQGVGPTRQELADAGIGQRL